MSDDDAKVVFLRQKAQVSILRRLCFLVLATFSFLRLLQTSSSGPPGETTWMFSFSSRLLRPLLV